MDEPYLIEQAQNGDVDAFNRLILHYQNMAYSVGYRIMGDPDSAADAAQDGFISAYENLNQFRGGNFKAWLMRIVTNKCYDMLKKRKRHPLSSLDEIEEENESSKLLRGDTERPERTRQRNEMVSAVEECLQNLPEDQRVIAILCDVEGYDYQTASEIAETTLGTVKSRLSRARRKLRDCLRGFGELLPDKYR